MRQKLGQHFLRDAGVVQAILAAAELNASDTALEIGPGKAVLTEPLAARVKRLVAVELDRELAPELKERFASQTNVEIVQGDFLKTDLTALFPTAAAAPIKVLGNLPYSITAPIFEKLLAWPGWTTGVFLIQREVADRIQAAAGSRAFGLLTLAVQAFATPEPIRTVPPGAFAPPPEVVSRVLRLRRRAQSLVPAEDLFSFFSFARAAFGHRRKTLANSIALATGASKEPLARWLADHRIDPQARAESLSLETYVRLAPAWSLFRRENGL